METKSGQYTDLVIRQDVAPGNSMDFTLGMKYLLDREQIKMAAFRGYAVTANDQPIDPTNRFYFAGLPQRPSIRRRPSSTWRRQACWAAPSRWWPRWPPPVRSTWPC
jgi:hypothetical protein